MASSFSVEEVREEVWNVEEMDEEIEVLPLEDVLKMCVDKLRVSPGDHQAGAIQIISPISLKLGQFKVSILKLKILKWFAFWNFPGGDRAPPLLF